MYLRSALKLSEIRLQLAKEEAADVENGQPSPHKISALVFVRMGLELEDQQYVFMKSSRPPLTFDLNQARSFICVRGGAEI